VPYIGQQPAPKVITSSDLSADVVTEAKIADNAVENEHLNANVITGHTALGETPADTDELLVSDAGTLKRVDFSYLKGGGAYEKLLTTTISSSTADISFNSTYITTAHRDYKVVFTGFHPVTDGVNFEMRLSEDNGSSYSTGAHHNYRIRSINRDSTSFGNTDSNGNDKFELFTETMGNDTGETMSGYIDIFDPLNQNSDDQYIMWNSNLNYTTVHKVLINAFGTGIYHSGQSTVWNNIKFQFSSGNIERGIATLYGRKI